MAGRIRMMILILSLLLLLLYFASSMNQDNASVYNNERYEYWYSLDNNNDTGYVTGYIDGYAVVIPHYNQSASSLFHQDMEDCGYTGYNSSVVLLNSSDLDLILKIKDCMTRKGYLVIAP